MACIACLIVCLLQESLAYSVVWQLAEPHRLTNPSSGSIPPVSSPIMLPSYRSPVQAAAAMLQQLQQHSLEDSSEPMALELPCLPSEACTASSAATASCRRMASAAAAMAALARVASSEASESLVILAISPNLPKSRPRRPLLRTAHESLVDAQMGLTTSLAHQMVGSHGAEISESGLFLPQIAPSTQPFSSQGMGGQASAGYSKPFRGSSDWIVGMQHGSAQHAFVTGGLGALGQLLALWLCLTGAPRRLSLAGRTGRAALEAGNSPPGQLPLWAQCLGLVGDDGPAVHMVRCDAAAREESAKGLQCQEPWGGASAVDSIFHAGEEQCPQFAAWALDFGNPCTLVAVGHCHWRVWTIALPPLYHSTTGMDRVAPF